MNIRGVYYGLCLCDHRHCGAYAYYGAGKPAGSAAGNGVCGGAFGKIQNHMEGGAALQDTFF